MDDKSTSGFRIRLDAEPPEPPSPQKPAGKKADRPKGQRVTAWIIFMVVLIAAVMGAGYWDIKRRLLTVHNTGTQEARKLAMDLESKFSSLSIKFSKLEESLHRLAEIKTSLEKNITTLEAELKKTNSTVSGFRKTTVDQKSLNSAVGKLEKRLSPLSRDVKEASAAISSLDGRTAKQMNEINKTFEQSAQDIKDLQERIAAVRTERATKEDLSAQMAHMEKELKKLQAAREVALERTASRIEAKMVALEAKIKQLADSTSRSTAASTAATAAPAPSSTSPKPGELIESDINQ